MEKLKILLLTLVFALSVGLHAQSPTVTASGNYTANGIEWKYVIYSNGEASIIGTTASSTTLSGVLNIPASVMHNGNGYPVTAIGFDLYNPSEKVFFDYKLLTDVTFPNSLKKIGAYSFAGCTGLTSLNLPNSLKKIGDRAFSSCTEIAGALTIPSSVNEIGANAFSNCKGLTSVNILGPVDFTAASPSDAGGQFTGCINLESISLAEGTTQIPIYFLNGCSKLTSIHFPSTITSIGISAFSSSGLTSISLPEGLTEIGNYAFYRCEALHDVTMPTTMTSLGRSVFLECKNLTSVTGYPATLTDVPEEIFSECKNLTHIDGLPNSQLTTVGNKAFQNCEKLTGIYPLASTLTSIGDDAYQGCVAGMVGPLTIPNTVTSIGSGAFNGCTGLTGDLTIEAIGNIEIKGRAFNGCTGLNGTLTLKKCTFTGDNQFTATQFHHLDTDAATLQLINGYMFGIGDFNFPSYPSMTFDESLITGISSIPNDFLANMRQLVGNVKFSPSLTSIGDRAFYNCGLKANAASIPSSVPFGKGAFRLSPNITGDIIIPDNYFTYTYFPWGDFAKDVPFSASSITSIDLGNPPFFFSPEYHHNLTKNSKLWGNEDRSQTTPNLLWLDARRCNSVYLDGSNNYSAWMFGRSDNYIYDDPRYLNFMGLKVNALVYLPTESTFQDSRLPHADATFDDRFDTDENNDETGGDGSNFIMDGKCKQFFVKDGLPYRVPFPFTAKAARYSRTFNVTTGKAVSTLYLPYPTDLPAGMCAYTLVKKRLYGAGEKEFVFREVPLGTRLEANKPYLVRITDGQPHKLPVMRNVTVPVSPTVDAAGQIGIEDSDWKFYGTTEKIDNAAAVAKKAYYLNGNKWWAVQDGVENDYIAPFRCFVSSPTGAAAARSFLLVLEGDDDGNVTGIKQLESDTEKDMHSGKYPFYSIDGKLMGKDYNKLERGQIYIVNGKKFYKF